jgi:DNA-binding NtrC family response regulator
MEQPSTLPGANAPRVLIVLREPTEARRIALFLEQNGMEVVRVGDEAAGYNILDAEQVDALITETRDARIGGMRLLRVARMRNPDVCAILLASPADLDLATRALDEGAHDFQTRPLNLEKLLAVIRRGLNVQRLVGEMHQMARRLDRKFGFRNLVGNSAPIVRVYNRILQVCGTDMPVLVTGESGTGRELVAAAIHHNSARRTGPLVRLDCEGLEPGFLEADLWGAEQSSTKPRAGRIELAEGGTLVLDGVDDLPMNVQARLLRLLRDHEYERVGGTKTLRADTRLVAIGSLSLRERVDEGRIRADLYDTLRTATIVMPALRHRKRDIPLLVDHLLGEAREETGRVIAGIKPAAMDRLVRYPWPGNVRELKSVVRAMVLTSVGDGPLDVGDLPEEIREGSGSVEGEEIRLPAGLSMVEIERRVIEATLVRTGGDRKAAARVLGIGLRTLQRRLVGYRRGT